MSYPNVLEYFMWGYQVHFRISAQTGAETLFNFLDRNLQPTVMLVGFKIDEKKEGVPIAVDPEDFPYNLEIFEGLEELANELAATDEGRNMLYSGPGQQEKMDRVFRERMFIAAMERRFLEAGQIYDKVAFVTYPVVVENYKVYIVLELDKSTYYSYQFLKQKKFEDRFVIFQSFLETTVKEFLEDHRRVLYLPEPGSRLREGKRFEELLREGARQFTYSVSAKGKNFHGLHGFYEFCEQLSTYRYENGENFGHLIIAEKGHPDIEMTLELEEPFDINEYRKTRKMLELTNNSTAVISDSRQVLGLGLIKKSYDPSSESIFSIYFKGVHCWDVFHNGINILQMRYGLPQFSKETIHKEKFVSDAKRHFPSITTTQIDNLYVLAMAATKQKKGAMLVITDKAQEEAKRFGKRCISIKPKKLNEDTLISLSSIDGGLLVDFDGYAYAKGVILDGVVGKKGDAGRGSRYNSAVTYCEHRYREQATMIVVVSSDGMVDIVPNLMPQIRRTDIPLTIEFLRSINSPEKFNRGRYYEAIEFLEQRSNYLSENDVDAINQLLPQLASLNEAHDNSLVRVFSPFTANPELNDSYFFPEDKPLE